MKQIHISLSDEATKELNELKKSLGVNTIAEVIRSSISIAKYLELEKKQGNEVIIRDLKNKKEKVLVTLK